MKCLGSKKSVKRRWTHGTPGGGRGNIGSPEKRGCSMMARRSTGGKTGLEEKNSVLVPSLEPSGTSSSAQCVPEPAVGCRDEGPTVRADDSSESSQNSRDGVTKSTREIGRLLKENGEGSFETFKKKKKGTDLCLFADLFYNCV